MYYIKFASQVYGAGQGETITPRDLASILQHTLGLPSVDELSLCQALQVDKNSRISLGEEYFFKLYRYLV